MITSSFLKTFNIFFLIQTALYPLNLSAQILIQWKPEPRRPNPELIYGAQEDFEFYKVALYLLGYFNEETPAYITGNSREHKRKTPRILVYTWDCEKKVDSMYSAFGDVFRAKEQNDLIRSCENYNNSIREQLQDFQKAAGEHRRIKNELKELENNMDEQVRSRIGYNESFVEKKLFLNDLDRTLVPLLEKLSEEAIESQELFKKFIDYITKHSKDQKTLSELITSFTIDLQKTEDYNSKKHGPFMDFLNEIKKMSDFGRVKEDLLVRSVQNSLQTQAGSSVSWLFEWKRTLKQQIQKEIDDLKDRKQSASEKIALINQKWDQKEAELMKVWRKMFSSIEYHYYVDIEELKFFKQRVSLVNLKDLFMELPSSFDFYPEMSYGEHPLGIEVNRKRNADLFFNNIEEWLGVEFEKQTSDQPSKRGSHSGGSYGSGMGRRVP